ncbi:MAG: PilN domain-containing protein [Sedimentisphaerales bacterium]|jgi:hypothetical protein|nr:PilN domain-containing protein [Sedimentisphaerales bacterium]
MANVNFVPDDYLRQARSQQTNVFYISLLLIVMIGLASAFGVIKVRQRACAAQEALVDTKAGRMREQIQRFDQLQAKRRDMMKAALVTAELIEPIPTSIILASLTNELPTGTSLLEVRLIKKEVEPPKNDKASNQKQAKTQAKPQNPQPAQPAVKGSQIQVDIAGLAPSDLEVAAYIERLAAGPVFRSVILLESKDHSGKERLPLREFRLRATVPADIRLTDEDLLQIRQKAQVSVNSF